MKRILTCMLSVMLMASSVHSQTNTEITVLFAYTTKAAIEAGGPKELGKKVKHSVKMLNEVLANSNINCTVVPETKFLHVKEMEAVTNSETLINELRQEDGKYNKIHLMRKRLQADIVCFIFDGGESNRTSMGELDGQFMVCTALGAWGETYIFPHEFGHVLGANHSSELNNGRNYNPIINGNRYRTVSNNGGVSLPYFSENRTIQYEIDGQMHSIKIGDEDYQNAVIVRNNIAKKAALGESLENVKKVKDENAVVEVEYVNPSTQEDPPGTKEMFELKNFTFSHDGIYEFSYNCHKDYAQEATFYFTLKFLDETGKEDPWLGSSSSGIKSGYPASDKGQAYKAERIKDGYRAELWSVDKDDDTKRNLVAYSIIGGESKVLRPKAGKF